MSEPEKLTVDKQIEEQWAKMRNGFLFAPWVAPAFLRRGVEPVAYKPRHKKIMNFEQTKEQQA